jgi:hypothetical protein
MCQDCGSKLEVIKTMVLDATTQRLRECRCGSRFITTEVVTRKLAVLPVTASQPPGNSSPQSSSGSSLVLVPSKPDQTQTPARVEPTIRTFKVSGKDAAEWALPQSFHEKLTAAFPAVDSMAQYAKVDLWAEANPAKRKTPRGMKAFLLRWFEKAQNDAGRAGPAKQALESFAERDARLKREAEARKSADRAEAMRVQRELNEQLRKAGAGA